jgi:putative flippase GtrA
MISKLSQHLIFRYIVSGGTSATVDLIVLYILNTVLAIHYLTAATIAFAVAFCVSFFLQKFWTFKNMSTKNMHHQVAMYLGTSLFGLSLNTLFMYIFVDHFHIMVLLSQIFAGALVACGTFFLSRNLVFKHGSQNDSIEVI